MAELITKDDLLNKLRAYCETPDDETIRYKNKIKNALLYCPELLYAMDEKELESELFDEDGNINWDPETHEPLGEWDKYFGDSANIRPALFIPDTQTKVKNYVCYQVMFDELPRYNNIQKYTLLSSVRKQIDLILKLEFLAMILLGQLFVNVLIGQIYSECKQN